MSANDRLLAGAQELTSQHPVGRPCCELDRCGCCPVLVGVNVLARERDRVARMLIEAFHRKKYSQECSVRSSFAAISDIEVQYLDAGLCSQVCLLPSRANWMFPCCVLCAFLPPFPPSNKLPAVRQRLSPSRLHLCFVLLRFTRSKS